MQPLQKIKAAVDSAYVKYQIHKHKKETFSLNVAIDIKHSKFQVKTVSSVDEFLEVLRLRYQVFHREGLKKKIAVGIDLDRLDFVCDHLIIKDMRENRIVGTYRLISSIFSDEFYSQNEFHLGGFLHQPGIKLELGRACTHKDYRNGITIALLWKGLGEYIQKTKAKYLFGCASVKLTDTAVIGWLTNHLRTEGHLIDDFGITPTPLFRVPSNEGELPSLKLEYFNSWKEHIPSLLHAYLRAGAKIYGEPALDKEYECIDYLTVLDTTKLQGAYEKRYQVKS